MKIEIEGTGKEIAELVVALQTQRIPDGAQIKSAIGAAMTKFCDTYDLHDDEIDAVLEALSKE